MLVTSLLLLDISRLYTETLQYQQFVNTTLCLKNVSTFKLPVTLSNLNQFSKFLQSRKAYEIRHKMYTTIPISP